MSDIEIVLTLPEDLAERARQAGINLNQRLTAALLREVQQAEATRQLGELLAGVSSRASNGRDAGGGAAVVTVTVSTPGAAGTGGTLAARLQELEEARKQGLISDAEYERMRREIVGGK